MVISPTERIINVVSNARFAMEHVSNAPFDSTSYSTQTFFLPTLLLANRVTSINYGPITLYKVKVYRFFEKGKLYTIRYSKNRATSDKYKDVIRTHKIMMIWYRHIFICFLSLKWHFSLVSIGISLYCACIHAPNKSTLHVPE